MERKTVKVKDVGLISFLYPDYQIRQTLTFADKDINVIYVGSSRKDLKSYLERNTKSYINTVGFPDLDMTNTKTSLGWLFNKYGQELTDNILNIVESMDDEEFWYYFKVMWVTGKWFGSKEDLKYNTFHLFSATTGSIKDELSVYFELLKGYNPLVLESSFLTFLSRVKTLDSQNVSPAYMKLLKASESKYGNKIKPSVSKMATRKGLRPELLFIDLITDLR